MTLSPSEVVDIAECVSTACVKCDGSGHVESHGEYVRSEECPTCGGTGFSDEVIALLDKVEFRHSTPGYTPSHPKMYEIQDAKLAVWLDQRRGSSHTYDVVLCSGEWPSDKDLVTICDGHYPEVCHFGGSVAGSGLRRYVTVHVD